MRTARMLRTALSYRLRGRHTVAGASSAAIYKYRYVITEDSAPTRGRRRHSRERVACGRSPARPGTETPTREELVRGQPAEEKRSNIPAPASRAVKTAVLRTGSEVPEVQRRNDSWGGADRAPIKVRKQERGKGKERKGKERGDRRQKFLRRERIGPRPRRSGRCCRPRAAAPEASGGVCGQPSCGNCGARL